MGDYSWTTVTIGACPEDTVRAVLNVLDGEGLAPEYEGHAADLVRRGLLPLGVPFVGECNLDTAASVTEALQQMPGVIAVATQDGRYEHTGYKVWLADQVRHTLPMGQDGEAMLATSTIHGILTAHPDDPHMAISALTDKLRPACVIAAQDSLADSVGEWNAKTPGPHVHPTPDEDDEVIGAASAA